MKLNVLLAAAITTLLIAASSCSSNSAPAAPAQLPVSVAARRASILTLPAAEGGQPEHTSPTQPALTTSEPEASSEAAEPSEFPASQTPAENGSTQESVPTITLAAPTAGNPPADTNPPPTSAPTPTSRPTETSSGPVVCSITGSSAFEAEVIELINEQRSAAGIPTLNSQAQLTNAARSHSDDMACSFFFSHTSPTSGTLFDRLAEVGYSYSWAGENIAAGYTTPAAVVEGWMDSEGHRANILNENFTQIGVGYASWEDSDYGAYWTAVFASP